MKLFRHLMHVTIFCIDIEKSIDYYGKLGFEVIFDMSLNPGDKPWNYYLRITKGEYIELQALSSCAPSPHPSPERVVTHADRSLWHFALETDNLRYTVEQLQAKGVDIWKDPEKSGIVINYDHDVHHAEDGYEVAWLIDPDGNPIEIMEPKGVTMQVKYDYVD